MSAATFNFHLTQRAGQGSVLKPTELWGEVNDSCRITTKLDYTTQLTQCFAQFTNKINKKKIKMNNVGVGIAQVYLKSF